MADPIRQRSTDHGKDAGHRADALGDLVEDDLAVASFSFTLTLQTAEIDVKLGSGNGHHVVATFGAA